MPGRQPLLTSLVPAPTGRTRVAAVVGDPVSHSLSPALHNAAYAAMGLDWIYVALPVPAGRGGEALGAMRLLGLVGLSVTMPHKAAVAAGADRVTATARRLGSANTAGWQGGELVADSTDGGGFVDALAYAHGWSPAGQACAVLGTGGAARAVTLALVEAGAASVVVAGRRAEAAASCAAIAGSPARPGPVSEALSATLVVNATPVGMTGGPGGLPLDLDPRAIGAGQLVADVVYAPRTTPLLAEAQARGATTVNGIGMLVHQAARQIASWTGTSPPLDVMVDAVGESPPAE